MSRYPKYRYFTDAELVIKQAMYNVLMINFVNKLVLIENHITNDVIDNIEMELNLGPNGYHVEWHEYNDDIGHLMATTHVFDSSRKEIFEGDIISYHWDSEIATELNPNAIGLEDLIIEKRVNNGNYSLHLVERINNNFYIYVQNDSSGSYHDINGFCSDIDICNSFTIVGNIHENPELLDMLPRPHK